MCHAGFLRQASARQCMAVPQRSSHETGETALRPQACRAPMTWTHTLVRLFRNPWWDDRLEIDGRQGQDGSCVVTRYPHEGGPNLGRPAAPLTAFCSKTPAPPRLAGFRYTPCTRPHRETGWNQWRQRLLTTALICFSIGVIPSFPDMADKTVTLGLLYRKWRDCVKSQCAPRQRPSPLPLASPRFLRHLVPLPAAAATCRMTGSEPRSATSAGLRSALRSSGIATTSRSGLMVSHAVCSQVCPQPRQ